MKKEFSQMALDFGMAEPIAPLPTTTASHNGKQGSSLGLSAEEEQSVHEEGRRAGVVVRIKSLKKSGPLLSDTDSASVPSESGSVSIIDGIAPPAAPVTQAPAPEPIQLPMFIQAELLPEPAPEPLPDLSPDPGSTLAHRPEPMPEPPPIPAPEPPPAPAPEPVPEPAPPPKPASPSLPRAIRRTKTVPTEKPKSKRGRKSLKEVTAEADLINIPEDEVLFSKQYYTMGEVAEMFRVNQSLLRFWETEFSILQPKKNKKGDRYFRPIDIKNLHLIYHLLRQRKYTIEGAKEFLRKNKKADERFETIQRLQQIKAFLLELKAQL